MIEMKKVVLSNLSCFSIKTAVLLTVEEKKKQVK